MDILRKKPDINEFTGIDFSNVKTIISGKNKNDEYIYEYYLNDVAELLDMKKKDLKSHLRESIDYHTTNNLRGQEVTFLTEQGLFKIMNDIECEKTEYFKNNISELCYNYYNYGVVADDEMKNMFYELITETDLIEFYEDNEDYNSSIQELVNSTIFQIE